MVAEGSKKEIGCEIEYNILIPLVCALILATIFRFWVLMPVRIVGESMAPSLSEGCWVLADSQAYKDRLPERGDIVLISRKALTKGYIVKRVIGLPGERIEIRDGILYVDDLAMPEEYILGGVIDDFGPVFVESGYFVLGDNYYASKDSRHWEDPYVEESELRGKVEYQVFPAIRSLYK